MSETVQGIFWGVTTNLAVLAMLNNSPFWDADYGVGTWLVSLGAANAILGCST